MAEADDGVVLLHGLGRSARAMMRLEAALRAAGYLTLNLDYPSRRHDIAALAAQVDRRVCRFANGLDGRMHFVTHSMGGLVARALIARHRPPKLGRVVMLAPPNQGSEIADLLAPTRAYSAIFGPAGADLTTCACAALPAIDFELGVIAGDRAIDALGWAYLPKPNDGKVSVARTKNAGMADHIVLPATHTFIMRHPAVIAATLGFLRDGRFPRRLARGRAIVDMMRG